MENTEELTAAIDSLAFEERNALFSVLNCLECPSSEDCLILRKLLKSGLEQIAVAGQQELQRAQQCQQTRALSARPAQAATFLVVSRV